VVTPIGLHYSDIICKLAEFTGPEQGLWPAEKGCVANRKLNLKKEKQ